MGRDPSRREREADYARRVGSRAAEQWGWSTPAGKLRAERRAELVARAAGLQPGTVALEIGCGNGLFTEKYARSGAALTATDLSPELIELARQAYPHAAERYLAAPAESLPLADAAFDAVVGNSILHHLPLGPALAEIFRVLRPGGRFAFAEPNLLNPQMFVQRSVPGLRRWAGDSPDETALVRFSLKPRLEKLGLVEIAITPFDFLHPAVPASLIPAVRTLGAVFEQIPLLREIAGSLLITGRRP